MLWAKPIWATVCPAALRRSSTSVWVCQISETAPKGGGGLCLYEICFTVDVNGGFPADIDLAEEVHAIVNVQRAAFGQVEMDLVTHTTDTADSNGGALRRGLECAVA